MAKLVTPAAVRVDASERGADLHPAWALRGSLPAGAVGVGRISGFRAVQRRPCCEELGTLLAEEHK